MASSIKLVEETYLANKENKKKLIAELKKLVKQGKAEGDSLLVGTA